MFRHLIESVVDYAIFRLDKDGLVATWNRGAERIYGYSPDEVIGRHFGALYTEEDLAAGVPARTLSTAMSEGRFEAEAWRMRKDGTRFWATAVVDPIRNDNKEIVAFATVTRDITERVETQRILRETQEQLALAQRMEAVGQLSGGIAHDFNNLLMIIMGNLERVRSTAPGRGESAANLQRSIANALRGAQRAAALTQRLLAFSPASRSIPRLSISISISPALAIFCNAHSVRRLKSRSSARPGSGPSRWTFRSSRRASSTSRSTPETRCRTAVS